VSIDALVGRVHALLSRSHTLFADPAASAGPVAAGSAAQLVGAGRQLEPVGNRNLIASGQLADGHRLLIRSTGADLSALAGADDRLARTLEHTERTQQRGSADSATALGAVAADTAALTPLTQTPAGQRALLRALRTRVAQQQRTIADARAAAAAATTAIRSLTYPRADGGHDTSATT
jgi:peptidoglycan DL-endopeptidase CwlO